MPSDDIKRKLTTILAADVEGYSRLMVAGVAGYSRLIGNDDDDPLAL